MLEHVTEVCQCKGKRCSKCQQIKCFGAFPKQKSRVTGVHAYCKLCKNASTRQWRRTNRQPPKLRQQLPTNFPPFPHVDASCQCEGKQCSTCKQVKCLGAFAKEKRVQSGLTARCVTCRGTARKEWKQKYPDKRRLADNRRQRLRYKEDPTKKIENHRAYLRAHPDYNKEYARKNPEIIRVKTANRRAHKKQANGKYTVQEWEALKAYYDYTCLCCGKCEPEIKLTPDHVVPLVKGGANTIDNSQPLCYSCNSRKRARIIDYRRKGS